MDNYSVLVVDDSAFMRKSISSIIEAHPNLTVIGRARNGIDAIEKVKRLKPDIVTLDIEMPELDGLQTLKVLMNDTPVPIVMLSNGADSTLEAFELGAVDFVLKNHLIQDYDPSVHEDFYKRLMTAVTAKLPKPIIREIKQQPPVERKSPSIKQKKQRMELLIIGSSTGGPAALQTILTKFPVTIPVPIIIIQHMPPGFTKPLADRFDKLCHLKVKEAEHNERLQSGTIYIAPAGLQTMVKKNEQGHYMTKLKISASIETLYKPSVDVTLLSVAEEVKDKLVTVILTGMGDDGLRGCKSVKKYGGTVIGESEESCVVYGMPKVVFEAGLVDEQIPLSGIFDELMTIL